LDLEEGRGAATEDLRRRGYGGRRIQPTRSPGLRKVRPKGLSGRSQGAQGWEKTCRTSARHPRALKRSAIPRPSVGRGQKKQQQGKSDFSGGETIGKITSLAVTAYPTTAADRERNTAIARGKLKVRIKGLT